MGRGYYYRIRTGRNSEQLIPLGSDPDKAIVKALDLRRKRAAGLTVEAAATFTLKEAADRWMVEYVLHNRTEDNQEDTRARLDRHVLPYLGTLPLETITASKLFQYRAWLAGRKHWKTGNPLSTLSVRHVLADVRALLNHCLNTGLLDRSPVPTRGWMPRLPERAPQTLTRAECDHLRGLPGDYGRVLRFLLATGLRWGELTRAQVSDIRDGVLLIPKSKSGKVRRVPLPEDALAECRGRVGRVSPFTLSGNFNTRVRQLAAEAAKELPEDQRKALEGLQRFHVHLTRHQFASEWRDSGGSLSGLQAILGHSTIKVTEQYGTIADDLVLREARRLEEHRAEVNGI
jgi:integrase